MNFLGGKFYLKKKITSAILAHTTRRTDYHEPFVGGANIFEEIAHHFQNLFISDIHPDLILLYQAIANGWEPPSEVSRELYKELQHAEPSGLRGFVGFGVSFRSKWFGGYLKDHPDDGHYYAKAAAKSLARIRPLLQRTNISHVSCMEYLPGTSSVVYCDPPYRDTTAYKGTDDFDTDRFWDVAKSWAVQGTHVFVSEYAAPDGWDTIWESEHLCSTAGARRMKRIEKLFVWKDQSK